MKRLRLVSAGAVAAAALLLAVVGMLRRAGTLAQEPQAGAAQPAAQAPAEKGVVGEGAREGAPPEWKRPRFQEGRQERLRMVRSQMEAPGRDVKDEKVLQAMREVPRHLFVPPAQRPFAYDDRPLEIGYGQTISQPFIVAYMTELLKLKPGDKVLEIGTGSGYQAAVLSELTPHVYTIEIIKELAEQAAERLKKLGYETVQVKQGDGYFGWEENGPFDAIIVTAAAGHVPPPLLQQLKPGGRLVLPLGGPLEVQQLVVIEKDAEGKFTSRAVLPVRFVPMTGRAQSRP